MPNARRRSGRSPRTPLSRERVIEAARRIADEQGIDALTMRGLAQELGVEAMTLYYHVPNKEAILSELADSVLAEFDLPVPGGDWKAELRATALSGYAALSRHRWAASLTLALRQPTANRLRYMDAILGTLAAAGFSADQTDQGYHVIEGHIMGFALWEVGMGLPAPADLERLARTFLEELPADVPNVVDHVRHHLKPRSPDAVHAFEFGLDLILDGLERLLPPSAGR